MGTAKDVRCGNGLIRIPNVLENLENFYKYGIYTRKYNAQTFSLTYAVFKKIFLYINRP